MSKVTINMHTLLTRLKVYKSQVNDKISRGVYIRYLSNSELGSEEQVVKRIQSDFDSTKSIISNIKKLESAKLDCNSKTIIKVRDEEMTVSQALQRLSTLDMEIEFLNTLERQFNVSNDNYIKAVEYIKLETKKTIDKMAIQRGKENPMSPDEIDQFTKISINGNKVKLVDPMKISDYILRYKKEIDGLKIDIDAALQTSNALTYVEVDLDD